MVERVTVNHQVGGSSPSSGASMSDSKNTKLVIIEDDKDIRELLVYNISRYVERAADHTTNIAEDIIFQINGKIVRHDENI